MHSEGRHLQELLAAIGEPSRFQIVFELASRERHVSDLAEAIGLSQSCTSRHLQALERAGVVQTRRAGKRVMASLAADRESVVGLFEWLGLGSANSRNKEVPGRTGGRDARHEVPQDAPPRPGSAPTPEQESSPGRAGKTRRGAGVRPGHAPDASRPSRADRPARSPAEVPPHGAPDASGTPAQASTESPGPRPLRRGDLEDFLL